MEEGLEPTCGIDEHSAGKLANVDWASVERAAAIFRSMGDPGRLQVLALLSAGEQCVSDLAQASGNSLPAVSQRLKLLRAERLVAARRDGKHVRYRLLDRHVADLVANALEHALES
jgi:ArsR family transcriptional regulator